MVQNKQKPGGVFKRFLAYLVDLSFCFGIILLLKIFYYSVLQLKINYISEDYLYDFLITLGAPMKVVLPLYFVYFEQTTWQATLGKKLLKIKVVDNQGKKISFWRSSVRVFLFTLIANIKFILLRYIYSNEIKFTLFYWSSLQAIKAQFVLAPEYVLLRLISVFWFITVFFTKNKAGVYELLSKTRVITTNK